MDHIDFGVPEVDRPQNVGFLFVVEILGRRANSHEVRLQINII